MTLDKQALIATRPYTPEDDNFIYSTWLKGLYHGESIYSLMPKNVFMTKYHELIEKVLKHPAFTVKVACLKDDPQVILGYAVMDAGETTLHWIFCKTAWRGIGVAKSLVPSTINAVTHLTRTGLGMLRNKPSIIFNPFLF